MAVERLDEVESLKNKSTFISCPKCERKYKHQESLDKHLDKCDGTKGNGGAREGAGHPPGELLESTKFRMAAKKEFMDRVAKHADALFNAQMTLAMGAQYLLIREKYKDSKGNYRWGKFEIVKDPEIMKKYLDGEFKKDQTQAFLMTAEKPNPMSIESLLDRAFGKAPQSLEIKDDRPDPIEQILEKFGLTELEGNDAGQTETTS